MVQNLILGVPNVMVLSDNGGFEPEVIFWSIWVIELSGLFNEQARVEMSVGLNL